jgi:MFS family permease
MTGSAYSSAPRRPNFEFWKFWAGQTISNLGSSISMFALPLLVFKLTGSALNLALASATAFLPYLLFGLVIGAWVDRVNRKRLMIAADIARALVIASIPLLDAFGALTIWWIYAVGFVNTTLTIGFDGAEFAAIPSLVHHGDARNSSEQALVQANGRIQASYSAASVAGPLLAGVLIAVMPVSDLLLFDSGSFLLSALLLAWIRVGFNTAASHSPSSILHDVREGLRYVLQHPVLRNISAMMALVNFFSATIQAQLVLFAKNRLGATDTNIGLLYSAGSVGIVVLALAAGPLRKRWPFSTVALGALMLEGVLMVALALTRSFWLALPIWMLASGLGILFNINTGSLRQALVPNHMLGRVISIAGVLAWSAIPLGTLLGGLAIEWTGDVALIYGIIGAMTVLIPLGFAFTPLGHAEQYLPREQAASEPVA